MAEVVWMSKTIQISLKSNFYVKCIRPATSWVVFQQDHWKYFHLCFLIILSFMIPLEFRVAKTATTS